MAGTAGRAARALAIAAMASSALATAAIAQQAQQKAPAAKAQPPAAAPAAKQQPAQAESQSPWVKLCEKAKVRVKLPDGRDGEQEKQLCLTTHEQLDASTGLPVVSAAIRQSEGSDKNVLAIMVPLGMVIPIGMKAAVADADVWGKVIKGEQFDEKKLKVVTLQYAYCYAAGCTAEVEATKELVGDMQKGAGILVLAVDILGRQARWGVPLAGFQQAFAGQPTDNRKYAEARANFMKQIDQQFATQREAAMAKDPKLADAYKKLQEAQSEMASAVREARPAAAPQQTGSTPPPAAQQPKKK
jgi:invasion protein IalB